MRHCAFFWEISQCIMCRSRRSRNWCPQMVKLSAATLLVLQIIALALSIKPNEDYISQLEKQNATSSQSSKVWKLATYSVDGLIASTALVILIVVVYESYFLLLALAIPFILFTLFLTILTLVKAILYSKTLFIECFAVFLSLSAALLMLLFAAILKKRNVIREQRNAKSDTKKEKNSSPLLHPNPKSEVAAESSPSLAKKTSLTPDHKRLGKLTAVRSGSAIELSESRVSIPSK